MSSGKMDLVGMIAYWGLSPAINPITQAQYKNGKISRISFKIYRRRQIIEYPPQLMLRYTSHIKIDCGFIAHEIPEKKSYQCKS